jgi:hypothetical protein
MITPEQIKEMLQSLETQEAELLAKLNQVAGAKDTLNHLLSLSQGDSLKENSNG